MQMNTSWKIAPEEGRGGGGGDMKPRGWEHNREQHPLQNPGEASHPPTWLAASQPDAALANNVLYISGLREERGKSSK